MILQVAGFLTQQARQWGIDAREDKLGRQTAPANLVSRSLAGNKTVDDAKTKTQNSTSSIQRIRTMDSILGISKGLTSSTVQTLGCSHLVTR